MTSFAWLLTAALLCLTTGFGADTPPAREAQAPMLAIVTSTQPSASGQIRQLAFDGDPATFFASKQPATTKDNFTLLCDAPVLATSIKVSSGRPGGEDRLAAGALEVSADGQSFEQVAKFEAGKAEARFPARKLQAVRIRPLEDAPHPLTIAEIVIESEPAIATFQFPIEFTVDVADAPELKSWAENTARVCERAYPMINRELASEGFKPPREVTMTLKNDYNGVAATGGNRITGSVKYFKAHQDDVGAMVHETAHVVQRYRTRNNPGWLVEGVADYVRFFKYEPGKIGRINAERARYNGSYRVSAAFLAYLVEKYDKEIVRKLNKAMRDGEYKEEIFKQLTGKTVQELDEEWRKTLAKS